MTVHPRGSAFNMLTVNSMYLVAWMYDRCIFLSSNTLDSLQCVFIFFFLKSNRRPLRCHKDLDRLNILKVLKICIVRFPVSDDSPV